MLKTQRWSCCVVVKHGAAVLMGLLGLAGPAAAQWGRLDSADVSGQLPTIAMFDVDGPDRFCPLIGIEAGGISLKRSADATFPLIVSDGNNGPVELLVESDLIDPEFSSGIRLGLQLFNLSKHVSGLDMELLYFDLDDQVANETVDASGFNTDDLISLFFNSIPADPDPVSVFTLDSALESVEWQLGYRPFAGLRLIGGLRWLDLQERFEITDPVDNRSVFADLNNDLFGIQIGAEATIWTNGTFRVFGGLKYAHLSNDVGGQAIAENEQVFFDDDHDSSLIDLEIGVSGAISRSISLHIAYQGLFLNDAAAVMPQSNSLSLFGNDQQTPVYTDIDWNGIHYGIAFIW